MDAVSFPLVFLAGIVSFAAPCFLPIVPVFVAYLAGQPATVPVATGFIRPEDRQVQAPVGGGKGMALRNSLAFVAAFSAVFIGLWGLISLIGWVVGDFRPALRVGGGILLILLGLYTGGILKLSWLDRSMGGPKMKAGQPTMARSALMGLAFGAGWSPCIGPVLGVVLGMAVTTGSAGHGLALLVVYCLGLGLPFVLVALGVDRLTAKLSWFSRHFRAIQLISAALLMLMGFLMITDLLAPLSGFSWVNL